MKKKKVMFFCKHNSCRSQMAEALMRNLAGDRFDVFSAGSRPRPIHPLVHTVMQENGIDTTGQASKSIDFYAGKEFFDYIIIVCKPSEADCPALVPMALQVLHWPLNDPASVQSDDRDHAIAAFREVRDEIKFKLMAWLETVA